MVARKFLLEPDYTRSFPNKKHVDFFLTGFFLVLAKGGLQLCITPEPRAMAVSSWLPCFPGFFLPTNAEFKACYLRPPFQSRKSPLLVGQAYAQGIVANSFQKALLYVGLYWPLSISWHVTIC